MGFIEYFEQQLAAAGVPLAGFGFDPRDSMRLYSALVGAKGMPVRIYEITLGDNPKPAILELKAEIKWEHWEVIAPGVGGRFNDQLKLQGRRKGAWKKGHTPIQGPFGKELMTLAWAIEELPAEDLESARLALLNWYGNAPEENWWLYLKADASPGWRSALRLALAT